MREADFGEDCVFELRNGQGVPLANRTVDVQVSAKGALVSPGPFVTDAQGHIAVTVTALEAGSIVLSASLPSGGTPTATASLFARGLEMTFIPTASGDVVVCEFVNTSLGAVAVPFVFGVAGPTAPPFSTSVGQIVFDIFGMVDTAIIEDGLNLVTGTQVEGGFGHPDRTNVYLVPSGVLNSSLVFQCLWFDRTTVSSIAGIQPSPAALSNVVPASVP